MVARPLSWDTNFFGVPMARIDYVLASPAATGADRVAAIDAVCAAARTAGVQHLTARVDVADLNAMGALEACGFRTMDALVTYIMRPVKDPPHEVRTVGTIRESREADAEAILEITREAYRDYRGRFHLDPHLPADARRRVLCRVGAPVPERRDGRRPARVGGLDRPGHRLHGLPPPRAGVEPRAHRFTAADSVPVGAIVRAATPA